MLGCYIGAILLLNLPYVQQQVSVLLSEQLSRALGSKLSIGRVNLGLLNRVIVDDLQLNDLSGKEMLKVSRLSAKFVIFPLFKNGIINFIELYA